MPENTHRLALRVAVKLAALGSLLLFAYILFGSLRCSPQPERSLAPLQQQVQVDARHPLARIPWEGGNVLVLYRDEATLMGLSTPHPDLARPSSIEQPNDLPALRAYHPARLVLFDRGGDMNCPLEWVPAGSRQPPYQPWPGGFREICRNTWYDAAGRHFGRPGSGRDIAVPEYHWQQENLLILGIGGDNPPPQP